MFTSKAFKLTAQAYLCESRIIAKGDPDSLDLYVGPDNVRKLSWVGNEINKIKCPTYTFGIIAKKAAFAVPGSETHSEILRWALSLLGEQKDLYRIPRGALSETVSVGDMVKAGYDEIVDDEGKGFNKIVRSALGPSGRLFTYLEVPIITFWQKKSQVGGLYLPKIIKMLEDLSGLDLSNVPILYADTHMITFSQGEEEEETNTEEDAPNGFKRLSDVDSIKDFLSQKPTSFGKLPTHFNYTEVSTGVYKKFIETQPDYVLYVFFHGISSRLNVVKEPDAKKNLLSKVKMTEDELQSRLDLFLKSDQEMMSKMHVNPDIKRAVIGQQAGAKKAAGVAKDQGFNSVAQMRALLTQESFKEPK